MRISLIGWRRSTLGIVTVVACASGIHLSGCVRSSSRDVSADLSRQAAESALKAERAIASRSSRRPIFESKKQSTPTLAEIDRQYSAKSNGGNHKNPLAELLAARNEKYPGGDPFIESEDSNTGINKRATSLTATASDRQETDQDIQLTRHQKELPLTDDGSAVARPMTSPQPWTTRPDVAVADESRDHHWAKEIDLQKTLDTLDVDKIVSRENLEYNQLEERNVGRVEVPATDENFSASDLGFWKDIQEKSEPDVMQVAEQKNFKSKSSSKKDETPPIASYDLVQALIQQSKSQHSRGELHAAYRSALLASSLVEKYKLSLAEDDINPKTVANEISAQIWGTSSRLETVAAKPKEADQLPIIRPRGVRNQQHDRVFQTPESFLNWQTSQEQAISVPGGNQDSSLESENLLETQNKLLVNSALFSSIKDSNSANVPEMNPQNDILQTSNEQNTPFNADDEDWIRADEKLLPKQGLNAPQLSSVNSKPAVLVAKPMPAEEFGVHPLDRKPFSGPTTVRQPLPAPSHEANPFSVDLETVAAKEVEEPVPHFAQATQTEAIPKVESPPQGQLKWGVVAFILATLSTLIGLKLSRVPAEQVKQPDVDNQEEEQHLKISKAA